MTTQSQVFISEPLESSEATLKAIFFPLELWDDIAYCIDSTKDLLSLALVCRALSEIVLPSHIHYRHICCDVHRTHVWEHLVEHPRRTRGIRSLKLVNEDEHDNWLSPSLLGSNPSPVAPKSLKSPTVSLFLQSLYYMVVLERFEWYKNSIDDDDLENISRSLVESATCLRSLTVECHYLPLYTNWLRRSLDPLLLENLHNLTKVVLGFPSPFAQKLLLHKCPNLEDLSLNGSSFCYSFLETGTWTRLRRLTLTGSLHFFSPPSQPDPYAVFMDFFRRHTNLACLELGNGIFPRRPWLIQPNFSFDNNPADLQMLRSFSWCWSYGCNSPPLYLFSESCFSRLEHLKTFLFESEVEMPNVETLQITLESRRQEFGSSNLPRFLQKFPSLKKMSIDGDVDFTDMKELIETLASLASCAACVTHIYLFVDRLKSFEIKELLDILSNIKTLKYLQAHKGSVKIERNPTGEYCGFKWVSDFELGQPPSEWGNFLERFKLP